jgi:putative transposase
MPGDSPRFDLYDGRCESEISTKRWRFTMKEYQSLSHTRWDCKYHVVFIPKCRKKRVFGMLRRHLGEIFRDLAEHKEAKIVEGHLMGDHVHMCISIPPKYAVANVVGYLKGKSAIQIARQFGGRRRNFSGENFWARGYFVSTVGLDEAMVRSYIRNQEAEDERYDQMKFGV